MKTKFYLLFLILSVMAVRVSAVNPDYQETENGVTSNKIIVEGCRAAVGRVYNSGVYDRGFCWSTSPNPTVSNSKTNAWYYDDGNEGNTPSGSSTISSSAGTIYIMEGLQPSTRYYIRPYIKTSRNGSYTYGKQYIIWTLPAADWIIYGNWDHYGETGYEDQTAYINTCLEKHCGGTSNASGELSWLTSCKQEAQDLFNTWTSFEKRITYNFAEWEDGAHCSYGGDPSFGPGFTRNTGTLMHETGHNLGVGTEWRYTSWDSPLHPTYLWTGERANRVFTLFQDKPDVQDENGNYTYGGNNTISDGDRVHVCYGLTGNINYIYRVRQAAYYEGMYQDGLSATGGDAGPYYSFETDAYMNGSTETDLNTKYYITNEDIATCNRYLCEENGKLTYKKITSRSAMLNNNAFAWYVIYNPSNAFYFIKNVSTGHYFSYNGSDFTMQSSRNEPIKLMPSRNYSTVNGQTLKAYWMTRGILDWEPATLSASRINQDVAAKAGFNLYDDAGYERWFILSADQVNAVGDVADPTPNQGLEQLTALPNSADYSKYFFVLTDHTRDLTMVSQNANMNGNENDYTGNHRRSAWYISRIDLTKNKNALWTLDYNNQWDNIESQVFTNAEYRDVQMQTEWNNPWYFRTSNNDLWWDRARMEYLPDGYWVIHNVPNGQENYLGPWNDGNFSDWQEMAFNKQDENNVIKVGHFNVYSLLRGEHVKYYQDYSSATPGNPLDITYVLENPGGERQNNAIGWQTVGTAWSTPDNNSLNGKVGNRFMERWDGNPVGNAEVYQKVYGLPNGYYRFSAIGTRRADETGSFYLYANNQQSLVGSANDGQRTTVVVEVTNGELQVGAKGENLTKDWIAFDDAQLEYIGTDVPNYKVDDPVLTFENNSYVDDVQSFTYDFIDAVSTDNSVSFTLLNPSAKVLIKKNGTTVKEGSVSLDGKKLTADFSGFTPELGTTYTLTLPAGVVGFAGHLSNVERTITFKTSAITAGYYYLRSNELGTYLSRGNGYTGYHTQAIMDNFGIPAYISTDYQGNTTIRFADSRQWLYGSGYTYTDQGSYDYALKFTVEPQGNGVYIFRNRETLNGSDQNCLSIWDGKDVICDAIVGSHNQGNNHLWNIESIADHRINYTRNADAQAAALGITGVSTWAQLESQMTSNYSGEVVYTDISDIQDHWQWGDATHYSHQLTGLTNGIYRITVNALQRASQWDWMWDVDNTYGFRAVCYLYGNDQKTQLIANTEDGGSYSDTGGMYWHNDLYYPNNTPSAERAFAAGKYKNTVYVKVTNGTLDFGINDPSYIFQNNQWITYKNIKVERMVSGLVSLEADGITDGGYISSPITSVTIKPLNTALTNVTIANNTKVTIYKDGVQLSQVTPTKSGANIVVALPTLENGSTYKLTLDEKKLTFNNNSKNAAFEVTFKTPHIYDGTYYMYNVKTDDFIDRSGNDVKVTFLGMPITWTNTSSGGTIKFNDGETNSYIGGRWYSSANESEGNAITWETTIDNGAYKLKRSQAIDWSWEYLYVDINTGANQQVASNGKCRGDNNGDGNFDDWDYGRWQFWTQEQYDAYVKTLDETSGTAPASTSGPVKVVFNRTISSKTSVESGNAWNTVCFPFALNSDQISSIFGSGTVVMELTGMTPVGENASLEFTEVDAIVANKPYIMQVNNGQSRYLLRGITITPSDNLTHTVSGIQFIGNYVYNSEVRNIPAGDFYLLNDEFKQSKNGTKLKGYRAYFHVLASSGIKSLGFGSDGDATYIDGVEVEVINFPGDIYSVGGQLIKKNATSLEGLPAGIYFVNGKKVLIK